MRHPEAIEQRLFIRRWRLDPRTTNLPACAIPNGGLRGKREAALMKAEGVDRGVPDWMLFEPSPAGHVGLALEFKAPGTGRVSADQRRWHEALRARGWRVEVVTSAHAAWQVAVVEYLTLDPSPSARPIGHTPPSPMPHGPPEESPHDDA